MSQLKVVTDKEAWGKVYDYANRSYSEFRSAVRLVLLNTKRQVAVLNVSKYKYYTLPGGGIDFGETKLEALHREAKEETGCSIEVVTELSEVLETRYKPHKDQGIVQLNYSYLANLKIILGKPEFIEKEQNAGYKLEWLPLGNAAEAIAKGNFDDYANRFTQLRDVYILEQAKEYFNKQL